MCVKIVAKCKEDVLLETVAIQNTKDRVFLFIRYLYPDETRSETKEVPGLICSAKRKSGSRRGFFRSRVRRYYKNLQLFMACIFFIFSGKLDIFMILHYDANWDKLD